MINKYLLWFYLFLVASANFVVAGWLFYSKGTPFGWHVANLSQDYMKFWRFANLDLLD